MQTDHHAGPILDKQHTLGMLPHRHFAHRLATRQVHHRHAAIVAIGHSQPLAIARHGQVTIGRLGQRGHASRHHHHRQQDIRQKLAAQGHPTRPARPRLSHHPHCSRQDRLTARAATCSLEAPPRPVHDLEGVYPDTKPIVTLPPLHQAATHPPSRSGTRESSPDAQPTSATRASHCQASRPCQGSVESQDSRQTTSKKQGWRRRFLGDSRDGGEPEALAPGGQAIPAGLQLRKQTKTTAPSILISHAASSIQTQTSMFTAPSQRRLACHF